MVDIQTLRWFQQVADGVTLTEVAEADHVSQPGVSRALTRLEKEVGTPLLRRTGRRLSPTRAGMAFKQHLDVVMHHLDDGLAAVEQLLDPDTGVVGFAFTPTLGTWLVPELVGSFRAVHPSIRFELRSTDIDLIEGGEDRGADLMLTTLAPPRDAFHRRHLLREPLRIALPMGHPLLARGRVALADLAQEEFICLPRSSALRRQFDELCEREGFEPTIAMIAPDIPTLRSCVASDLGVALVPALWSSSTEPVSQRLGHVALVGPGAERDIHLAWPADRRMLPATALLRAHIIERAEQGLLPRPLDLQV